jgi:hypothetical protein
MKVWRSAIRTHARRGLMHTYHNVAEKRHSCGGNGLTEI